MGRVLCVLNSWDVGCRCRGIKPGDQRNFWPDSYPHRQGDLPPEGLAHSRCLKAWNKLYDEVIKEHKAALQGGSQPVHTACKESRQSKPWAVRPKAQWSRIPEHVALREAAGFTGEASAEVGATRVLRNTHKRHAAAGLSIPSHTGSLASMDAVILEALPHKRQRGEGRP